jgi:prepilin-type N-terminal cleavage/methylation domain-containing protein
MTKAADKARPGSDAGFTLIETVVALGILTVALLSLAGMFTLGLKHMAGSSSSLVAREKAREAVESVHTARDTRTITWAQIRNTGQGGVFDDRALPLNTPGDDGLVNTSDDGSLEQLRAPGADYVLGTSDDVLIPLNDFTRQVLITDITDANGVVNPNLRQIRVIVNYKVNGAWRTYTLTTFISSFS